jgi:hypothetical protein
MKITREKNAPDFLIVGAAKSGTTSLWYYLNQHPQIFMNQGIKELGYFSDHYGISDFDEYLKYFDNASNGQMVGEACHTYLSSPESAQRIYKFNPQIKLVLILRNPVERAYSLYNWMVEHGYEKASSFEDALALEELRVKDTEFMEHNPFYYMNYLYFRSGLYHEQVKRYYDLFPKENIHLIVYESFRQNNLEYTNGIFEFLKIPTGHAINLEKQNITTTIKSAPLHFLLLDGFYPLMDKFFVPRKISAKIWNFLMKRNKSGERPQQMKKETYTKVFNNYSKDISDLSTLTGIDFFKYWSR